MYAREGKRAGGRAQAVEVKMRDLSLQRASCLHERIASRSLRCTVRQDSMGADDQVPKTGARLTAARLRGITRFIVVAWGKGGLAGPSLHPTGNRSRKSGVYCHHEGRISSPRPRFHSSSHSLALLSIIRPGRTATFPQRRFRATGKQYPFCLRPPKS